MENGFYTYKAKLFNMEYKIKNIKLLFLVFILIFVFVSINSNNLNVAEAGHISLKDRGSKCNPSATPSECKVCLACTPHKNDSTYFFCQQADDAECYPSNPTCQDGLTCGPDCRCLCRSRRIIDSIYSNSMQQMPALFKWRVL